MTPAERATHIRDRQGEAQKHLVNAARARSKRARCLHATGAILLADSAAACACKEAALSLPLAPKPKQSHDAYRKALRQSGDPVWARAASRQQSVVRYARNSAYYLGYEDETEYLGKARTAVLAAEEILAALLGPG